MCACARWSSGKVDSPMRSCFSIGDESMSGMITEASGPLPRTISTTSSAEGKRRAKAREKDWHEEANPTTKAEVSEEIL